MQATIDAFFKENQPTPRKRIRSYSYSFKHPSPFFLTTDNSIRFIAATKDEVLIMFTSSRAPSKISSFYRDAYDIQKTDSRKWMESNSLQIVQQRGSPPVTPKQVGIRLHNKWIKMRDDFNNGPPPIKLAAARFLAENNDKEALDYLASQNIYISVLHRYEYENKKP